MYEFFPGSLADWKRYSKHHSQYSSVGPVTVCIGDLTRMNVWVEWMGRSSASKWWCSKCTELYFSADAFKTPEEGRQVGTQYWLGRCDWFSGVVRKRRKSKFRKTILSTGRI